MIRLDEINDRLDHTFSQPTILFRENEHAVYWLGTPEDSAFRCNAYLVADGAEMILVDPGGVNHFGFVHNRVSQITDPGTITGIILCHQDPDIAGSVASWLKVSPRATILSSLYTNTLLPYYGNDTYVFRNIDEEPEYTLPSGGKLRFIPSPFLHSPGAFTTWDETSRFLFSGDIWAAIDMEWELVVRDFTAHRLKMDLFNIHYMSGSVACRGFLERLKGTPVEAILPQHGSILPGGMVADALKYLSRLRCGIDLIYPEYVSRI